MKAHLVIILSILFSLNSYSQSIDTTIYKTSEISPEFPGGDKVFIDWLMKNISYPDSARSYAANGILTARFIIEKDGSISNIKITDDPGHGCAEEVLKALKKMPLWKAGNDKGQAVRVQYILPVSFIAREDVASYSIFPYVEHMPEFPGGEKGMYKYLAETIKYPATALKKGIEGKVYIHFIIDSTGMVKDAKIARGIGGGCDEEALRVVESMPQWKPGSQQGRAVNVQFTLPIAFNSNKSKKK